jgi:hypothetical protein
VPPPATGTQTDCYAYGHLEVGVRGGMVVAVVVKR